ncbi:MAG TPA: hypothetical protein VKK31_08755 [Thermoanaerobaculia bacterium]|nr:hypothetical protein [Thermoanaerobaculia bacterium]
MSSTTFRRAAAALLIVTFAALTAAAPSHAFSLRRSFDEPVRTAREGGFLAFLARFFDSAGGAMDPNGNR